MAQQTSTYSFDVNGRPVEGASLTNSGNAKRETVRSVNGRSVPVQTVEDKVISNSGGVKVIERMVRKFDPDGNPAPPEKVRIEERKGADGSGTVSTTVLRPDLNGNYSVAERTNAEIRKVGDTMITNTSVERPTLNGSVELVEKREENVRTQADGSGSQSVTVFKRDSNGRFDETAKETMERKVSGNRVTENSAVYEATNGRLDLVKQTVANIQKAGNKEVKEVNVFVPDTAGKVSSDRRPQLQSQQIIEKSISPGGSTEVLSVRRASDAGLGAAQKVSETVCRGECK